jgi:drug/metabolite transporter (DMT)-like permease
VPSVEPERRHELLAVGALVWTAALFGTSFVVVKDALDEMRPVPYLAMRFSLAALVFAALAWRRPARPGELALATRAGVTYAIANVCQTIGLERTTPATAAFLTYLLIVAVPILQFVFAGVRPSRAIVVAIAISVAGLVLLTGGTVGLGFGSLITIVGAVLFGLHIIQMGDAAGRFDVVRFNAIQIGVVAVVLLPFVPFTGGVPTGRDSWVVIVYAALVVTVGTFVPWMWAQRHLPPTRAALILLTEPVFAAAISYATGERLGAAAAAGALLILVGAALAEVSGLWGRGSDARGDRGVDTNRAARRDVPPGEAP